MLSQLDVPDHGVIPSAVHQCHGGSCLAARDPAVRHFGAGTRRNRTGDGYNVDHRRYGKY